MQKISQKIANEFAAMEYVSSQEMAVVAPRHHSHEADGGMEVKVDISRAPSSSNSAMEGVEFSEDPENASAMGVRGMTVAFKVRSIVCFARFGSLSS